MKILHVITGLNTGGAESMLFKLVSNLKESHSIWDFAIVSLTDYGDFGKKFLNLGIKVYALGMKRGKPGIYSIYKLIKIVKSFRPDVIQTWMYHADLIGAVISKITGNIPVVWNIRHGFLDPTTDKRSTLWVVKICSLLSNTNSMPEKIICCSMAAQKLHEGLGYNSQKFVIIPNGFDLEQFKPAIKANASLRQELGIKKNAPIIGLIARFHPQKDHENFLKACSIINAHLPETHFVLCGQDINWNNSTLVNEINKDSLANKVYLLGKRDDISTIASALDILVSSSYVEGFSNVIGEAMACGVPCVVTDVGDSAIIVGDTGKIVPPKNSKALAKACMELLELDRDERIALGLRAREHVEKNYGIESIVKKYGKIYKELNKARSFNSDKL